MFDEIPRVAQHGPFLLTKTGAIAERDATFEEYAAALAWCQEVEKASPFWVGDLITYGEHRYGEMYAQAIEVTGNSYGTVANAAWVTRQIEPSRRRENLSFAVHQEIAPLPPADQDAWLDRCEAENLTRDQLRMELRALKAHQAGNAAEFWLVVKCASADDQTTLADRLRLEGRVVKLTVKENG